MSKSSGSSLPLILGVGGIASVLIVSGITGESIGNIFKGQFGHIPKDSSSPASTGVPANTSGDPSAIPTASLITPPGNAPAPIVAMVQWCNSVAGRYQYTWGGGHQSIGQPNAGPCNSGGSGNCYGYDCSGTVSGALGAAGLLSSPLDSTGLESFGAQGAGKYVTIFANKDHTFMRILGHWFGTGKLGLGGGPDWGNFDPALTAYVVRHPNGF